MEFDWNTSIYDLPISIKTQNALHYAGFKKLKDLDFFPIASLAKHRNIGKKTIIEIENLLSKIGATLDTGVITDSSFNKKVNRIIEFMKYETFLEEEYLNIVDFLKKRTIFRSD